MNKGGLVLGDVGMWLPGFLARLFVLESLDGIDDFANAYAQQINDEGAMQRAQELAGGGVRMPVEEVMLTARFKVDLVDVDEAVISEIYRLSEEYREIVNELLELAVSNHITSFVELYHAKYRELWQRCPTLPSHYVVNACRHAASIYKSFIKRRELGMCEKEKPMFKRWVIWLDKNCSSFMPRTGGP